MQPNTPSNPGSFMAAGGQPGVGPALARAMKDAQGGGVLNQNSQSPGAVMPPAPPPPGQPIPAGMTQPPQSGAGTNMPVQAGDPELQIALNALAGFIKSHTKVKEAQAGIR